MTDETQDSRGSTFTRRRLLGTAAAAGGAGMALAALAPNVERALASAPPSKQPSLRDIEHVVLLMQENRSFDHYFGAMSGVAPLTHRCTASCTGPSLDVVKRTLDSAGGDCSNALRYFPPYPWRGI